MTTTIAITAGSIKFATTSGGLTTAPEYAGQIVSAEVQATPNLVTVPATWAGAQSQRPGATSFALALDFLQDWDQGGGLTLSEFAWDNDAQPVYFEILPDSAATEPKITGQVYVVAANLGGAGSTPLQAQVVWPCVAKPTITFPTVVAAADRAGAAAAF
jgi:hypothetical protein